MKYMEAMVKIEEHALAHESPFEICAFYREVQDIVAACEASKEDVVIRAFTRMHERGQLMTVRMGDGKASYISAEKYQTTKEHQEPL